MAQQLTVEQRESYARDGFVLLRGVFQPHELEAVRPAVNPRDRAAFEVDPVLSTKVCFGNPINGEDPSKVSKLEELRGVAQFAGLHALCADQRISGLATQLLGEQAELMKDKFIFKAAGQGMPFTPHQDMQYIYHRVVTDAVNFYVAFDDANEENGALQVVKGLERCLHGRLIADPTEEKIRDDVAAMMHFEPVALCKGDVLAFSGWVPHRSGPNLSSRHRSVYYPTYGIWPGPRGKLYETYYEAYWQWVRGNTVSNRHGSVDKLFEAYGNPRPSLVTGPVVDLSVELARLG